MSQVYNAPEFWALLAFLLLAGWATTLIFLAKQILPMANALGALGKLNSHIDELVQSLVERIIRRREKAGPQAPQREQKTPAEQQLDTLFGGPPIEPVGEQPPNAESLEVMS